MGNCFKNLKNITLSKQIIATGPFTARIIQHCKMLYQNIEINSQILENYIAILYLVRFSFCNESLILTIKGLSKVKQIQILCKSNV